MQWSAPTMATYAHLIRQQQIWRKLHRSINKWIGASQKKMCNSAEILNDVNGLAFVIVEDVLSKHFINRQHGDF